MCGCVVGVIGEGGGLGQDGQWVVVGGAVVVVVVAVLVAVVVVVVVVVVVARTYSDQHRGRYPRAR